MATKQVSVIVVGNSASAQKALGQLGGATTTAGTKLEALSTKMQTWGSKMSSWGSALTRSVTLPLVAGGVGMVNLAAHAEETENKVRETFSKMAGEILGWSRSSLNSMGLASATAQDMASQFGLLFQAAKLPGKEVVGLSEDFTQLAVDMSSFFDVPVEQALGALRSGIVGESEPLRQFGVLLSEAAVQQEAVRLGLVDTGEELTEQQKVIARTSLIQEGLTKASGDYARTSDSTTNQARRLKEQFIEMGTKLGRLLLPLADDLLKWASDAVQWFDKLSPRTKEWGLKVAGVVAVAGPLLRILGPTVSRLGKFAGWLPKLVPWLAKWAAIPGFPVPSMPVPAAPVSTGVPGAPPTAGIPGFLSWAPQTLALGWGATRAAQQVQQASSGDWRGALQTGVESLGTALNLDLPDLQSGDAKGFVEGLERIQHALLRGKVSAEQAVGALNELSDATGIAVPDGIIDSIEKFDGSLRNANTTTKWWTKTITGADDVTVRQRTHLSKLAGQLADMGSPLSAMTKRQIEVSLATGDTSRAITYLEVAVEAQREKLERQTEASKKADDAQRRLAESLGGAGAKAGMLSRDLDETAGKAKLATDKTNTLKDELEHFPREVRTHFDIDTAAARAELRDLLNATRDVANQIANIGNTVAGGLGGGGGGGGGGDGGGQRNRPSPTSDRIIVTVARRTFAREQAALIRATGR